MTDWRDDPRFGIESIVRQTADELIDTVIMNAKSAETSPCPARSDRRLDAR